MVSRAKKPGALMKAEDLQPSLEHWIQKKGQNPWQPGYFKSESPAATASEAYAKFCTEAKPSRCQRDASAAWALWQACLDSTELLAQRREECNAWQAKGLELECKCEQLEREKQSLEEAWEAEKLRSGHVALVDPEADEAPAEQESSSRLPRQAELQERCRQLEKEKAQWEAQRQELKAELGKMKQDLELGQGHLTALLKANQEDRETCRNLQESYAQCQAEIERLQKQSGTQQAATAAEAGSDPEEEREWKREPEPEPGPASAAKRSYGAAAEPKPWAPERPVAEPPTQEERICGPSGGLPRGQPARRWKCPPRWKRVCRGCGAWGRAERRGGAWDCPWCRAAPQPWRAAFAPRGGHSFPGRARAAAAAFPMRGPGMQEPGRVWSPAPVPWRGPPRRGPYRGLPWRRRAGSLPIPGAWMCQQCKVTNYAHRAGCYRCHSPRVTDFPPESELPFHQA